MAAPIFNHFTYRRGPLGATLACNHCKHFITIPGAILDQGIVATKRKEIGDHVRKIHADKLTTEE